MTDPLSALMIGRAPAVKQRLDGWVTAALLVGLVSLGLPWGTFGAPGYQTIVRVPVIAAGVAVYIGWRLRSRSLLRVGMALAVVALLLARLVGGGAIALLIALVLLELGVRRTFSRQEVRVEPSEGEG
jgi:hypothetical protein